jgi:hypothetical protein
MFMQLLNKGFTIKQHNQLKTDSWHLRHYFIAVRFI